MTSTQLVRSAAGRLRRRILGIADEEASSARRGFRGGDEALRRHLDAIGRAFLHGYHAPWRTNGRSGWPAVWTRPEPEPPRLRLRRGAAWGSTCSTGSRPGIAGGSAGFLAGPGSAHAYMVHVGAGWALAQLRRRVDRALAQLRPPARLAGR